MKAATAVVCFDCGELAEPLEKPRKCPECGQPTYPLRSLFPKYQPEVGEDWYEERARVLGQVEPVEADIIDGRLVRKTPHGAGGASVNV